MPALSTGHVMVPPVIVTCPPAAGGDAMSSIPAASVVPPEYDAGPAITSRPEPVFTRPPVPLIVREIVSMPASTPMPVDPVARTTAPLPDASVVVPERLRKAPPLPLTPRPRSVSVPFESPRPTPASCRAAPDSTAASFWEKPRASAFVTRRIPCEIAQAVLNEFTPPLLAPSVSVPLPVFASVPMLVAVVPRRALTTSWLVPRTSHTCDAASSTSPGAPEPPASPVMVWLPEKTVMPLPPSVSRPLVPPTRSVSGAVEASNCTLFTAVSMPGRVVRGAEPATLKTTSVRAEGAVELVRVPSVRDQLVQPPVPLVHAVPWSPTQNRRSMPVLRRSASCAL